MSYLSKIKINNLSYDIKDATATENITQIQQDIEDIQDLIPNQATSSNQLADKDYVDSAVSTGSGNFVGTFDSVEELEAVSNPSNNDYGFVKVTDSSTGLVSEYDRYKYNSTSTSWLFEYALNNSSFTSEQWAAINSGATAELIDSIDDKVDKVEGKDLSTNDFTDSYKEKVEAAITATDEGLSTTISINADTLDGYHAAHFSDLVSAEKTRAQSVEDTKVDKVTGKQLSTNDYTTAEKTKLAGIATGATANTGTVTSVAVKMNDTIMGTVTTSGTINLGTVGTVSTSDTDNLSTAIPVDADTLEGHDSDYFVAAVSGKSLSTNDFTNDYKTKLDNINSEATKVTITTDSDNNIVITYIE